MKLKDYIEELQDILVSCEEEDIDPDVQFSVYDGIDGHDNDDLVLSGIDRTDYSDKTIVFVDFYYENK